MIFGGEGARYEVVLDHPAGRDPAHLEDEFFHWAVLRSPSIGDGERVAAYEVTALISRKGL